MGYPNNSQTTIDDGLPPQSGSNGGEIQLPTNQSGEAQAILFLREFNQNARSFNAQVVPRITELETEVNNLLERLTTISSELATLRQEMGADNAKFITSKRKGSEGDCP